MIKKAIIQTFISLITLVFLNNLSFGQELNLKITAQSKDGQPIINTKIILVETQTRKTITKISDSHGSVSFHLTSGKVWQMNIKEIQNYYMWQFEIPKVGISNYQRTVTYNLKKYQRDMSPSVNRTTQNFEIIKQGHKVAQMPTDTETSMKFQTIRKNKKPLKNFEVTLTSLKDKKSYVALSDNLGYCYFLLPNGQDYEIDLEGMDSYSFVEIPVKPRMIKKKTVVFEPMNFTETETEGVITQYLNTDQKPISARHLLDVTFKYREGGVVVSQKIKIKDIMTEKYYEVITDSYGNAIFMLPKGHKFAYISRVFEDFEEEIEVKDLSRSFGISKSSKTVYIPKSPKKLETNVKFKMPKENKLPEGFFTNSGVEILSIKNMSPSSFAKNHIVYTDPDNVVGIQEGFLLTTGNIFNMFGPNDSPSASATHSFHYENDIPIDLVTEDQAYDACILEIEFKTNSEYVIIDYVFASEEYPDYLEFDDSFGAYLSGPNMDKDKNIAVDSNNTRVSVANNNNVTHSYSFIQNNNIESKTFMTWQYDGFTKKNSQRIKVKAGEIYILKLIIFDRRDSILDSGVFVGLRIE
tara:strand:- start:383 stop:2125 length:1743 start_codon:yes stop_codon:yes gene_type:complete